jgi:hypothetical protein
MYTLTAKFRQILFTSFEDEFGPALTLGLMALYQVTRITLMFHAAVKKIQQHCDRLFY